VSEATSAMDSASTVAMLVSVVASFFVALALIIQSRRAASLRVRESLGLGKSPAAISGPLLVVDANNVRGATGFAISLPELCFALGVWAEAEGRAVVVAIDHGDSPWAVALSPNLTLAFSGARLEADDLIVLLVDECLSSARRVEVVTSDAYLRRRCAHQLPTAADAADFSTHLDLRPRAAAQRGLCRFEASGALAARLARHTPRAGVRPPAWAAALLDAAPQPEADAALTARQRKRRRHAAAAAAAKPPAPRGEVTEERVAAAAALHRRLLDRTRGDTCSGDAEWWRNRPFADHRVACAELMRPAEG